jgi:hypothetical protein
MANDGYESLNDTVIYNIKQILANKGKILSDKTRHRIKKLYEETFVLWGYDGLKVIDIDEVIDICKRILLYNSNPVNNSDIIYIKTVKRSLIMKKIIESMNYNSFQKYHKYHKYFEYIIKWVNSIK